MSNAKRVLYTTVEEPWSRYKLEDGTIIKAKVIVSEIKDTGEILPRSEPKYEVKSSTVVAVELPE